MPELSEDENTATLSYKAINAHSNCDGCEMLHCDNVKCFKQDRKDGRRVIWVRDN